MDHDQDRLPHWFTRPVPHTASQPSLFTERLDEVLARQRVSTDELRRWAEQGWISFDLGMSEGLEEWHVNEIRFVRDVLRSGLAQAQAAQLLSELPRPLSFSPEQVAYSFTLGWVAAADTTPGEPEEVAYEWIEELESDGSADELRALQERIEAALKSVSEEPEDG